MRAQHSALPSEVQEKKRPHTKDWCGAGSRDEPAGAVVGEPVVVGDGRGGAPEVLPDPRPAGLGVVGHPVDGVSAEVRAGERALRRGVGHGGGGLVRRRVGRGGREGIVRRCDGRGGHGDRGDRFGARGGRLRGGGLVRQGDGLVHRRGRRRGGRDRRRGGGEHGLVGARPLPALHDRLRDERHPHDDEERRSRHGGVLRPRLLPPQIDGLRVLREDHRVGGLRLGRRGRRGGLGRRREPLLERLDHAGVLEEPAGEEALRPLDLDGVPVGRVVEELDGGVLRVDEPHLQGDALVELLLLGGALHPRVIGDGSRSLEFGAVPGAIGRPQEWIALEEERLLLEAIGDQVGRGRSAELFDRVEKDLVVREGVVELVSGDPARDLGLLDERIHGLGDELLDALEEVLLDLVLGQARAVEERLREPGDALEVLDGPEGCVGVVHHLDVLVGRGSAGGRDGRRRGRVRLGRRRRCRGLIAAVGVAVHGLLAVVAHGGHTPVLQSVVEVLTDEECLHEGSVGVLGELGETPFGDLDHVLKLLGLGAILVIPGRVIEEVVRLDEDALDGCSPRHDEQVAAAQQGRRPRG